MVKRKDYNDMLAEELEELENKHRARIAAEMDKFVFTKFCKMWNSEFAKRYGLLLDPSRLEEIFRKGLAFDRAVDDKGFGAVYGIKTSFYEENIKLKKDIEILSGALKQACERISVIMPPDVSFLTGEMGTYIKDPDKMYEYFIAEEKEKEHA